MIARAVLFASLLPLSALAQLEVYVVNGTTETPVGAIVNITASPGDTVTTTFSVRNTGSAPAVLNTLSLAGTGFSFGTVPQLPYTLPPYTGSPVSEAQFQVSFSPTAVLTYNAFLNVNTIEVILQGNVTQSAVLTLAGSSTPITAGSIIDFGSVLAGETKLLGFNLSNPGSSAIPVGALSVAGAGFKGPIGASAPLSLAPGQTVSFQVEFLPNSGQTFQGTLAVDQRTFVLTGQGLNPPLPTASIVFGSSVGQSAQQNTVSIPLASASQVAGYGTLTMTFQPSVQGVEDDPAVQFLSGPTRNATVTISPGDTSAQFDGGASDLAFQTGTTAGTITFTLTLNGNSTPAAQATLTIAPAAVNLQTVTCVRLLGELNVSAIGFDNTYSASELGFTFFDKTGAQVEPGAVQVNAGSDFQSYFATTQAGGMFGLLAAFPVSGDTSQIVSVNFQVTNSVGTTQVTGITIGN